MQGAALGPAEPLGWPGAGEASGGHGSDASDGASLASVQGSDSESESDGSPMMGAQGAAPELNMPGPGVVLRAACEALQVTRSEVLSSELAVLSMLGFGLHVLRGPLERQLQLICEDFDVDAAQYFDGAAVDASFAGGLAMGADRGGGAPGGDAGGASLTRGGGRRGGDGAGERTE